MRNSQTATITKLINLNGLSSITEANSFLNGDTAGKKGFLY